MEINVYRVKVSYKYLVEWQDDLDLGSVPIKEGADSMTFKFLKFNGW